MILTCPECATSYFVDDSRIPPAGRRVRCSSCGHRWTAGPDGPIAEQPAFPAEPEIIPAPPEEPVVEAPPEDVVAAAPPEPEPAPLRRPPPRAAPVRPAPGEGRSSALVWAGAAALAAALIAGVIVFREQIVRLWPKSSAAYAGLGLPVDGGGLVLEQVHVQPAFLAGRPVLSVSGAIHNVRGAPVTAPPVRFTLLNHAGQPVEAKIARPVDATIPGRAVRRFEVTLFDPPASARDLEVRFETPGDGKTAARPSEAVLAPTVPPPPAAPTSAAVAAPAAATAPPVYPAAPAALSPAMVSEHG